MTDPEICDCGHAARIHTLDGCQAGTYADPCRCALSEEGVVQRSGEPAPAPRETLEHPRINVAKLQRILDELPEQMAMLPLLVGTGSGSSGVRTVPGPRTPNMGLMQMLDTRTRQSDVDAAGLAELDLVSWGQHRNECGDPKCQGCLRGEPRQGVLPELWLWCRMVEADRLDADPQCPDWLPDEATVASACGYLAASLSWIVEQQYATVFAGDLTAMSQRVRAVLRERDPYRPRHVGASGCGWTFDAMDNGTWYRCSGCGKVVDHWAEMQRLMGVQQVTLRQASELTGVPVKTLHRWHADGILTPSPGQKRDRMFDLDQIRKTADRIRRDTPGGGRSA